MYIKILEVINNMLKLDYTLETPEERKALVEQILADNPNPPDRYLEILADYLILCMEKQEKKEKKLLTENRLSTINKRETSFEGLVSQFENSEDGIYNLVTENNKNAIFQPKVKITKQDLEEIPFLVQIKEAIEFWEEKLKSASGRNAYIIKHTIIDLRKEQYIVKNAYRQPITLNKLIHSNNPINLDGEIFFDEEGYCKSTGVTLVDPEVCSAILCNYSRLKRDSAGNYETNTWYLMDDFDNLCEIALAPHPIYEEIVICKIDGLQNTQIQEIIKEKFGIEHSLEYISSLWRKKIPALIASAAEDQYLDWYYLNEEKGNYKRCSRCGQIKLAHNKYFSKNKTSKDGFYSICKECRNTKDKNE